MSHHGGALLADQRSTRSLSASRMNLPRPMSVRWDVVLVRSAWRMSTQGWVDCARRTLPLLRVELCKDGLLRMSVTRHLPLICLLTVIALLSTTQPKRDPLHALRSPIVLGQNSMDATIRAGVHHKQNHSRTASQSPMISATSSFLRVRSRARRLDARIQRATRRPVK